jgi:iron-sulfur cluster repair protein YtfE (RIC family)
MIPITRALNAEHLMFNAVFDEVERLLPRLNRLMEVKRLARLVEGLLRTHAKAEDDLLMLAQSHGSGDKGRYARCHHQHHEIDSQLTRVHSAVSLTRARKLLRDALAASRKHFQHEERKVFPLLERGVKPEELTRLGTAWFLHRHAPPRWAL